MTERHFLCTACGKCCNGWLPLTLADALAHAARFPLAMVWTPVRRGARAFNVTAELGVTVGRKIAVQIAPMSYLPRAASCPALEADGRCGIHADKPLRCRAMPLYPYRDESDQRSMLIPRPGWACDVSPSAPVVWRDGKVVDREHFDAERKQLRAEAPTLRAYAEGLMAAIPWVAEALSKAAAKPAGGFVVLNFSTILPRLAIDPAAFAAMQAPVLTHWAAATADKPEVSAYHAHYRDWARELEGRLAK
ncbi:MAG: YkgJ family cysteine cluster protein [Alphaproteobacteria bacterium]|nr:YkgJ family cysteine cluster protein [Alphaproteobacteria bacterium]